MPFVGGLQDRPAAPQAVGEPRGIGVLRHARGHALLAFEDPLRAGESFARQASREQAVGGCLGGVELLGVGSVAQEFPKPRGLRARRAERTLGAVGVEFEELGGRRRRGERARRPGRVEHRVMRAAEELADADARFVTGDRRQQELPARSLLRLRQGQHRGEHHRTGVQHRSVVHVVLLDDVRGCAVDEGGAPRAATAPIGEDFAGPRRRPRLPRERLQSAHRPRILARQR